MDDESGDDDRDEMRYLTRSSVILVRHSSHCSKLV